MAYMHKQTEEILRTWLHIISTDHTPPQIISSIVQSRVPADIAYGLHCKTSIHNFPHIGISPACNPREESANQRTAQKSPAEYMVNKFASQIICNNPDGVRHTTLSPTKASPLSVVVCSASAVPAGMAHTLAIQLAKMMALVKSFILYSGTYKWLSK
ncbi:uncharacterized protein BDW43DRAFT_263163 [Aspergillus alliaceus]|uniref:uncharacterized protein n=1 Tax=Petromyces alliaceus TaxID=209559 RepID=UPI0012A76074|nr:uncharacterized protein BDW43DRAFT_263163 [Aspergillus alliaceus]KAB8238174.1 hypothetical protein BDW43DRAFT_263163 [Aspergillus alliaceus]